MATSDVVREIFEIITQRQPDPGEVLTFLDEDASEADVASAIASSAAALAEPATTVRVYEAVFGRKPDAGGFNYWVDRLNDEPGFTVLSLATQFVASPEFAERFGVNGLDPNFNRQILVEALYENVLGRAPDPDGLAFWLSSTFTPAQLVVFFSQSPEFVQRAAPQIQQFFIDIALGDDADPSGADDDDYVGSIFDLDTAPQSPDDGGTPPGGGGGGPVTTFTVGLDANGDLVFGGNATGPVSLTVTSDGRAVFGRGGAEAELQAQDGQVIRISQDAGGFVSATFTAIGDATDGAPAGSVILVGAGTYPEDVAVRSDVFILLDDTAVVEGGLAVAASVGTFSVYGGTIDGGLSAPVSGITSAAETKLGIYTQGASTVNVRGTTFVDTDGTVDARGMAGTTGAGSNFNVSGATFDGLLTGIYLNPFNDAIVIGSTFKGNEAGIGGVGTGTDLAVAGSDFTDGNAEDIGVEGSQVVASFSLNGNTGLDQINVYQAGGPANFAVGDVSVQRAVLVGTGNSIASALAVAGTADKVVLGSGTHTEVVTLSTQENLTGVAGAVLTAGSAPNGAVLSFTSGSSKSTVEGLTIQAGPEGQGAIVTVFGQRVTDVTLRNNVFDGGDNTAGSVVYLNPGADGWLIDGNTFKGANLTASPLLGIEGAGHKVSNNTFEDIAGPYAQVESFTPSVVFDGNNGLTTIETRKIGGSTYELFRVDVSDLTGVGRTEINQVAGVNLGAVRLGDSGSLGREDALQLVALTDSARLRFNEGFGAAGEPPASGLRLGDIDVLQFDYAVTSSSRPDTIPTLRLAIDGDGDLGTTTDRGELVIEWAYQGLGVAPRDGVWRTFDASNAVAWQRSNSQNFFNSAADFKALSIWKTDAGFTPAGGVNFSEDSAVLGFSIAYGSSNGSFVGQLDNLAIGSSSSSVYLYSFG